MSHGHNPEPPEGERPPPPPGEGGRPDGSDRERQRAARELVEALEEVNVRAAMAANLGLRVEIEVAATASRLGGPGHPILVGSVSRPLASTE